MRLESRRFSGAYASRAVDRAEFPDRGFVEVEEMGDLDFEERAQAGALDHLLMETKVGWRSNADVPDRLLRGVRNLLRKHNVKQINSDFDQMEQKRLQFSLQELNTSSWFRERKSNHTAEVVVPQIYGPRETLAYTTRRIVPVYSVLRRVFEEIKRRRPGFRPESMLDFGAGPAPSVWSSHSVWPDTLGFSKGSFSLIEPSRSMRELGQDLLNTKKNKKDEAEDSAGASVFMKDQFGGTASARVRRWSTLRDMIAHSPVFESSTINDASTSIEDHHLHDIVIASNVISELSLDSSRDAAIDLLWHLTVPGGILVLVERGNQWGSNVVNRGREMILAKDSMASVVAPCTHRDTCPLLKAVYPDGEEAEILDAEGKRKGPTGRYSTTWCHFGTRTGDETIRKLVGNRSPQHKPSYDKFSYIVLEKGIHREQAVGKDEDSTWGRIVRPPLRRGKHVVMDICASNGSMERRTFGKKKHRKDGVYRAARRAEYGAIWPEAVD